MGDAEDRNDQFQIAEFNRVAREFLRDRVTFVPASRHRAG
jgi:hypothetical protein